MGRKLFCEISPFTYWLSEQKNILQRHLADAFGHHTFACKKSDEKLPHLVYGHQSVIRRALKGVDRTLQENKAVNLSLAAPKVNGILICPGETFSFWKLVGKSTASKGFKEGLTISNGRATSGIGGGMCQFTNLIHWMILHSPLTIVEHHHHDGFDLFPDSNRKVPFGTGTSISYNYLDYRVKNDTDMVFQLIVYLTDTHLCGELRASAPQAFEYVVETEEERFVRESDEVYRVGSVYRTCIDKSTQAVLWKKCIRKNHAKVLYDTSNLEIKTC